MWVADDGEGISGLAAEAPDDRIGRGEDSEGLIPELLVLNDVKFAAFRCIEVSLNFNPRKERIQLPHAA